MSKQDLVGMGVSGEHSRSKSLRFLPKVHAGSCRKTAIPVERPRLESSPDPLRLPPSERLLRTITSQHLGSPHRPVAVLGWCSYMAIDRSCLSNIFWSGFWDGDATARVRAKARGSPAWKAGSKQGPTRNRFATASPFRVQIGSKQKAHKSRVFSKRSLVSC